MKEMFFSPSQIIGEIQISELHKGSKLLVELRQKYNKNSYNYYVYCHVKDNKIIYVGKGKVKVLYGDKDYSTDTNQRCFSNAGRKYKTEKYIDKILIVNFYKFENEALLEEESLTKLVKEQVNWYVYNIDNGNCHTEQTKEKISKNSKGRLEGEKNPMYKRNWRKEKTEEELEIINKKIKNTWDNKSVEEKLYYKNKCRNRVLGEKNPMYGKEHSVDTKKKCGEKNKIKVIMINDKGVVKEYDSIKEASDENNTNPSSIIRTCKGKQKTANNMLWYYEEDIYDLFYGIEKKEKEEV